MNQYLLTQKEVAVVFNISVITVIRKRKAVIYPFSEYIMLGKKTLRYPSSIIFDFISGRKRIGGKNELS